MAFGDRLPAVLTRGQLRAEATMLDTFEASATEQTRVDGFMQDTTVPKGTTRGTVSGRSREGDTNTRTVVVGGVERPVIEGGLKIPVGSPVPAIGWEYELTALGPATDPALLGRRWRVVDVPAKSHATARRLDVVEVTS